MLPPDPLLHAGLAGRCSTASWRRRTPPPRLNFTPWPGLLRSRRQNDQLNSWDLNLYDSSHIQKGFFGVIGEMLPVLLGASCLLMLLVCINIASLLGQHAARRRREIAIRTALGARPSRIASQVFIETGLLALAGALAGWAASVGISRAIYVLMPDFGFPLAFNLQSDWRITVFVAAIAIVVTLICGMYPIRQSLRVSQREALHEGSAAVAGSTRKRIGQRILLGVQLGHLLYRARVLRAADPHLAQHLQSPCRIRSHQHCSPPSLTFPGPATTTTAVASFSPMRSIGCATRRALPLLQ